MINIGFERIMPTPNYPHGTSAATLSGRSWGSQSNIVNLFKAEIKIALRKSQLGRCCFCRRLLYHDYATHIEHFVDKDGYGDYTFEILNLAVSCGTCNIKKNGHFSTWSTRFSRLFTVPGHSPVVRCPVLKAQLVAGAAFPNNAIDFRWVNPHVHNYSDHIEIDKGWIFHGKTREGMRTIRGVKLNDVGAVELRALAERLGTRGGRLSMLIGAFAELDVHRARDVAKVVVSAIKRRREANAR
ncbi:uncharacterized protein (TIGR02646 family) [Pseudomonas helmanticensis]|uniref:Uncharacterized protein (TIGR02646 family) n=1 Tax=Pseudomonas helmanticensis TaxID=1471381 RepID=A0A4R7VTC9_9PSED|nr:HNH endonuclease [Pseudomonas helmanticensis]TDV53150.1 uncharacterized protein (TIGR02646 family) [Pseudomonas helmanticensis]